jgi:hypothetical protein
MLKAFLFATGHDAPPAQRAALRGDHRTLPFTSTPVAVENDPTVGAAEFVCSSGIGEQRCVVPVSAAGVEHGQPSFLRGIEPSGRNLRQRTVFGRLPIFPIDVEHLRD